MSTTDTGMVVKMYSNFDQGPTASVKVRQAMSLAIDRQTIIDKAAFGHGKVSKSMWPDTPNLAKYRSPNVPYPKYDPAAAEKLLDDAGYKRGPDGVRFTLSKFLTSPGEPESQLDVAQLIKDMFSKVGIQTTIVIVDPGTRLKMIYVDRPRNFDITVYRGRAGPTPYYSAKSWVSRYIQKAVFTDVGYNNSEVDRLYNQVANTPNENEQVQLYNRIDEILNRDMALIPVYDYEYAQPRRNTFKGHSFFEVIPESGPVENVWWTQGTPMTTTAVSSATTAAQPPTGGFDMTTIGAIVVLIVVVAGAAFYMSKRKKTAAR
jgi:peptide/nickel transport system substrate-binding protein